MMRLKTWLFMAVCFEVYSYSFSGFDDYSGDFHCTHTCDVGEQVLGIVVTSTRGD